MTVPYGIIECGFWRDPEIKRGLTPVEKLLLTYLFSAPGSNMSGIYYCPLATMADEVGVTVEEVRRALGGKLAKYAQYDEETEEIFVYNLARKRVGEELKGEDNRRKHLFGALKGVRSPSLLRGFEARYKGWKIGITPPERRSEESSTPSKGLRSPFEAITVTEQEQEQTSSVGRARAPADLGPEGSDAMEALSRASKNPTAWRAEVAAWLNGSRGRPVPTPEQMGRALWQMHLNGDPPKAILLQRYLEKLAQPPPNGAGTVASDELDRWAREQDEREKAKAAHG